MTWPLLLVFAASAFGFAGEIADRTGFPRLHAGAIGALCLLGLGILLVVLWPGGIAGWTVCAECRGPLGDGDGTRCGACRSHDVTGV